MDHGEIAQAQSSSSAVGATQNAAVTIINRHLYQPISVDERQQ
jgi:hypothetical protein